MSKKPESFNLGEFSLTFPRKNMEKGNNFLSQSQQPYYLPPPSPISNPQASGFNLNEKVSPSILLIIIILAIIFFISGLLHLLVRFLLRPPNRDPDDWDNVTALQGQLQQLFHLHDSGVDQTFIDALPVFNYKSIIGAKSDPFDCAVCLCEFEGEDKLRLLPKCSHAFHMECIDTWLLSHSTCPLCRSNLIPDFSPSNSCSAIVLVLESGNESAREVANDGDGVSGAVNSQLGFQIEDRQFGEISQKSSEIQEFGDLGQERRKIGGSSEDKVVAVKLGKFRSINGGSEEIGANDNAEARRCFSMGSFEYVMDEDSQLQVPIRTPLKKPFTKKASSLPLKPGHRPAMSECDCDSRREFNGFEPFKCDVGKISSKRSESFSVSKIWLRGKKEKPSLEEKEEEESPEGRVSFRFPVSRNVDEEVQSCKSFGSEANQASYAKRTLLWFLRREKEVHSSFSSNV